MGVIRSEVQKPNRFHIVNGQVPFQEYRSDNIHRCREWPQNDYEKAFDSVEHFAIFDALRKININENYIQILENIYKNATARIHIDNLRSEPFPVNRGVRQGDPISPKLFTAAIEELFKKSELSNGINIDGEILTNLRFASDVALLTESTSLMEEQLNTLNIKIEEVGLKMHKGKTKFMTNYENDDKIQIENASIEKVQKIQIFRQINMHEGSYKRRGGHKDKSRLELFWQK
ncbi:endonuclease-reverse transcriptase [Elysia marginata]|uniref:Endonuclease-reverse transcriptase n=1 Tax=Elysia marginata TaxID=1093978 RepID=A0AAV4H5I9_9GAST|nr:endonuclease-reverse transcriptase [Elysia marginata]